MKRPLPLSPTKRSPLQKRVSFGNFLSPSKSKKSFRKLSLVCSPLKLNEVRSQPDNCLPQPVKAPHSTHRSKLFPVSLAKSVNSSWVYNLVNAKQTVVSENPSYNSPAQSLKSMRKLSLVFSPSKSRGAIGLNNPDDHLASPLNVPVDNSQTLTTAVRRKKFRDYFQGEEQHEIASQSTQTDSGVVTPLKIIRTKNDLPKTSSSQSSYDYRIDHHLELGSTSLSSQTDCGIVTPLKVIRSQKVIPKTSSSQSSHDYRIDHHLEILHGDEETITDVENLRMMRELQRGPQSSHELIVKFKATEFKFHKMFDCPQPVCDHHVISEDEFIPHDDLDAFGANVIQNSPTFSEMFREDTVDYQNSFLHDQGTEAPEALNQHQSSFLHDLGNEAPKALNQHQSILLPVTLVPEDVPGAILRHAHIQSNTNKDLIRWLNCRDIPVGTKPLKKHLVALVKACIAQKRDSMIYSAIDSNKHYNAKRDQLAASQGINTGTPPFPRSGWGKFPICDIPSNFNFGSVYHYLVETMPHYEDDGVPDEDSGAEEVEEAVVVNVHDPFEKSENDEMLRCKKLRRGLINVLQKQLHQRLPRHHCPSYSFLQGACKSLNEQEGVLGARCSLSSIWQSNLLHL